MSDEKLDPKLVQQLVLDELKRRGVVITDESREVDFGGGDKANIREVKLDGVRLPMSFERYFSGNMWRSKPDGRVRILIGGITGSDYRTVLRRYTATIDNTNEKTIGKIAAATIKQLDAAKEQAAIRESEDHARACHNEEFESIAGDLESLGFVRGGRAFDCEYVLPSELGSVRIYKNAPPSFSIVVSTVDAKQLAAIAKAIAEVVT